MYKYFKELDKPNDFDIYLKMKTIDRKQRSYINNVNIPHYYLKKYEEVFQRINFIDMIIEGSCKKLYLKYPENVNLLYDKISNIYSFFETKNEEYGYIKYLKEKIDIDSRNLECLFSGYLMFCSGLEEMYPCFGNFILKTKEVLKLALKELKTFITIDVPPLNDGIVVKYPNAWYITPNGYLYNTGRGHKEGNLVYPFYHCIKSLLSKGEDIPYINLMSHVFEILQRGYVTSSEFRTYANLIYDIPTIQTYEVECAMEEFKNLSKLDSEEIQKMTEFPHYQRTYQPNIINLVVGYLSAKTSLFQSMIKLNSSNHKKQIINELSELLLDDILVRFCGFHKVSSVLDKTITTSSLNSIEKFKEYLDKGWTLDIIPGVIYDGYQDKLMNVDFNSYYVSEYLEKN